MRVDPKDRFVRFACRVAAAMTRYHRAALEGEVPRGPALLVGNHGTLGLETPVFFWLLKCQSGRFPVGLADRRVFGGRVMRRLVGKVGGIPADRDEAVRLLREGNLVVCYPGGAREVFKRPDERYQLRWERTCGFAKVAIEAQVPIVPFAGLGVDHSFVNLGKLASGRYAPPLALGPLPARLLFRLGAPIVPPTAEAGALELKARVQAAVEQLLEHSPNGVPARLPAPVVP